MKNWKTTLSGFITALGVTLSQSDDAILRTIGIVLNVAGPLILGISSKDNNVTGGSVQQ